MPASLFNQSAYALSVVKLHDLPRDSLAEIAFAGRSNAGKSSAINTLAGRKRLAFTSKTPGRTQMLNFFAVDPARLPGRFLVDLPGYGYARVPGAVRAPWGAMIEGYLTGRAPLAGLVLVMDARHPLTPLDRQLIEWFAPEAKPLHVLLTKADKLTRGEAQATRRQVQAELVKLLPRSSAQLFSSLKHQGVEEAEAVMRAWLHLPETPPGARTARPAADAGRRTQDARPEIKIPRAKGGKPGAKRLKV